MRDSFPQELLDNSVVETAKFITCLDGYPVNTGHMLIISKRKEATDFFELDNMERNNLEFAIYKSKKWFIQHGYPEPDGWNIGMNCGQAGGQTVMQFHCHLIPRYNGDMEDPRGGVRHVIPEKGAYSGPPKPFNELLWPQE